MTANDVGKAEKMDFLLEMPSKVTTDCDNSSGSEYETWGLGGYILYKNNENAKTASMVLS